MGDLFFRSDDHFLHRLVAESRGFNSSEQHDETLIRNHNSVVRYQDTVWFLGDLHLRASDLDHVLAMVARMNGTKHLILGNHDPGTHISSKGHHFLKEYYRAFESVNALSTMKIAGQRVLLSHLPFDGDHSGPDRYPEYQGSGKVVFQ